MNIQLAPQYRPHAKQKKLHRGEWRFLVIAAGVRGGKTYAATVEFLRRIYLDLAHGKARKVMGTGKRRQPALLYWLVAPTSPLTKQMVRYLLELVDPALIERVYEAENCIWLRPNICIEIKTAERPDLLVSASVNGMLIDEACRVKPSAWKGALRGRLTDTAGWAIFATSPLGGRNNWVYQELVSKAGTDPEIVSVNWTTADNPFIPAEEIESARRTLPVEWFKREYEANWDAFGGAVYPEFSDAHICSERELRLEYRLPQRTDSDDIRGACRRIIAGVDFGFTSPGAIVVIGQLSEESFVVLEESYAANRPILGHGTTWLSECIRLQSKWGVSVFACDPARPDAIHDLTANGIHCSGARNDIYLGVRRMSEAMHAEPGQRPKMRVLNTCANLIRELRNYQWAQTKDGASFQETPADGQSDHACDAARYGFVELKPYAYANGRHANANGRPIG